MDHRHPSTQEKKAQEEAEQNVSQAVAEIEVVEIKDECFEKTEDLGIVEVRSQTGDNLREAGFVRASALLLKESEASVLSPGFRSVAASAGWDDEALLLASYEDSSSLGDLQCLIVEDSPVRELRERKRGARTPALAKTPASARRSGDIPRNRRPRTQNIYPIDLARVGALSLEDDPVAEKNEHSPLASAQPAKGNVVQDETSVVVPEKDAQPNNQKKAQQPGDTKPSPDRSTKGSSKSAELSPTKSEKGSSGPACWQQLSEELSCAVCLDICFEPSTTSCGHSFCKMCLENVIEKCGPRCPKCRQPLKGDFKACPINTVLWNTVQLLFPKEVAETIKAKKESGEASKRERMKEKENSSYINQVNRGLLGNNWQGHRQPTRGIGLSRPAYSTTANNFRRAFQSSAIEQEVGTVANVRRNERAERGGGSRRSSQEELDAALASRLQQEELMRTFRGDGGGGRRNRGAHQTTREQTRNVSSAAANLRAMASRAIRLRARNQ
ncbi:hypothetical protein KI387_012859 [Taxus chinensis]|uniref:RING-type E3 ubiquitin transferase n=1 Tax=Taxus chinensis TaxID=29808 RepID=A0AA38CKF9_TAXCH|nr:hypothetical protein KI387_012859 [Taxus chinensis]